jgi:predicted ATPase
MINRLRIQRFKCLRDVEMTFEPLTVLIGPNDSGKSSILQALRIAGKLLGSKIEPRAFASTWRRYVSWQTVAEAIAWEIEGRIGQEAVKTSLELSNRGIKSSGPSTELSSFAFGTSRVHRFDPAALRRASAPKKDQELGATGSNLAAVLNDMLSGPDIETRAAINRTLHESFDGLSGVHTRAARTVGARRIAYSVAGKEKLEVGAEAVSDGALLLTAYLTLVYSETADILLVEEPENGLHPSRLKTVFEMLRKITTGELGSRKRQVILTTHSPLLLNFARPEEVRIVRADEEIGTKVVALEDAPAKVSSLLKDFSIGELWFMLGEEGLVSGEGAP